MRTGRAAGLIAKTEQPTDTLGPGAPVALLQRSERRVRHGRLIDAGDPCEGQFNAMLAT